MCRRPDGALARGTQAISNRARRQTEQGEQHIGHHSPSGLLHAFNVDVQRPGPSSCRDLLELGVDVFVDDADGRLWSSTGVYLPQDTERGRHEGILVDVDGNVSRFRCPPENSHHVRGYLPQAAGQASRLGSDTM